MVLTLEPDEAHGGDAWQLIRGVVVGAVVSEGVEDAACGGVVEGDGHRACAELVCGALAAAVDADVEGVAGDVGEVGEAVEDVGGAVEEAADRVVEMERLDGGACVDLEGVVACGDDGGGHATEMRAGPLVLL